MRTPAVVLLIALTAAAPAQTPQRAIVAQPEVEVRAGPSYQFPATGRLRRGVEVTVEKEENGWLAIKPPADATSWVPNRFLKWPALPERKEKEMAYIDGSEPVAVRQGAEGQNRPLNVDERKKLQPGFMVTLIGEQADVDGALWVRIRPHFSAVRYLPREAFDANATLPAPTAPAQSGFAAGSPPPGTATMAPVPPEARQPERPANNFPTASQTTPVISRPAASSPVTGSSGSGASVQASHSSGPGWLRRTAFRIDGQPAYALEEGGGRGLLYIIATGNVDLDKFVNRRVDVKGTVHARPLSYTVMTAAEVVELR